MPRAPAAPSSPELDRLVEQLALPPFHDFLQPEAISADPSTGVVVVRLPFRPEFRRSQQGSHYHGGILASLIDLTGHAAVAVRIGRMVPTVDLRVDYLRAAPGTELVASGRVVRAGRTIAVADVEVRA